MSSGLASSSGRDTPDDSGRRRRRTAAIQPVRARILSCFNATCLLGYLVEQILDLDPEMYGSPAFQADPACSVVIADEDGAREEKDIIAKRKIRLARQLTEWLRCLDDELKVDVQTSVCPPPHFVVNLAVSWALGAVPIRIPR
jgi:hypothetical protein